MLNQNPVSLVMGQVGGLQVSWTYQKWKEVLQYDTPGNSGRRLKVAEPAASNTLWYPGTVRKRETRPGQLTGHINL